MKLKSIFINILILFSLSVSASEMRYVGGDISMLPTYQEVGSVYKDAEGNPIDLLPYLNDIGMNAMRVRLFVNPTQYTIENGVKKEDTNVCQDIPYIIPLCQQIIDNGMDVMLDFHYSDTWADPAKQYIPDAWKDLTDEELIQKIYDYTKESLLTLKQNRIIPKFIQPGNEISYGMLWAPFGTNGEANKVYVNQREKQWQRFGDLLRSAIKACREVCPDSEIIIHTERVAQVNVLKGFYQQMEKLEIDYDIIGLSYYPYFHGKMSVLNNALTSLESQFPDKPIMIVETGFPIYWAVEGSTEKLEYEISPAGQDAYAHDLVDTLLNHPNVNGLFWWWLEYNPHGKNGNILNGWYNAPLFDPNNGNATPALKTIASFGTGNNEIEYIYEDGIEDGRWYDLSGKVLSQPTLPGLYIHNGKKIMIK